MVADINTQLPSIKKKKDSYCPAKTNQCATQNYCLINSVINTWRHSYGGFSHCVDSRQKKLYKIQCGGVQLSIFIKRKGEMFAVKRNLFIQGNIWEIKNIKFCNKLLVEFNGKKYLCYKSHIYKIKNMTLTSTTTNS